MMEERFYELAAQIAAWHEHTFPDATEESQILKLNEEFAEYADGEFIEEMADVFIVAASLSERWGNMTGTFTMKAVVKHAGKDADLLMRKICEKMDAYAEGNAWSDKKMNDRFKFRAWNKKTKTMHYKAEQTYDTFTGSPRIWKQSFSDVLDDENYIVEQCTGIKDANGKLVFEGDIIFINGEKWRVIWNDEDCAFFFSNLKEVYHQPISPDFYRMTDDFKVIGNVHENAELMR